jgi:hypothetical protein
MADVTTLFEEFIERQLAGEGPDAFEYVEQLEGDEREELAELIDAYLEGAPRDAFDPHAYTGSAAERAVEAIDRSVRGASGLWPAVLPRLRNRMAWKRSQVVDRLAQELGVPDRAEKVRTYYHDMESGTLASERVSDRVLDALASLYQWSAEALRAAGRPLGEPGQAEQRVFARGMVQPDADGPLVDELERKYPEREQWDEVDELFLGRG